MRISVMEAHNLPDEWAKEAAEKDAAPGDSFESQIDLADNFDLTVSIFKSSKDSKIILFSGGLLVASALDVETKGFFIQVNSF